MKRVAIVLLIMFAFLINQGQVFAQEDKEEEKEEGKKYTVNLSLWHPVSINKTKHDTVNLNLSLLYGRVGYVNGLDLSLIASVITHDLEGVQLCGGFNISGNNFTGLQAVGLFNIVGEKTEGVQAA